MRVRMRTVMAGPDGVADAGAVIEVPAAMARGLVSGGYAEALEQFPPEAATVKGGREKAMKASAEAKG